MDSERAAIREKGNKCRARGCKCLARCFCVWNRYWNCKVDVCARPNRFPADDEWWGDQPPFVGNRQKPRQSAENKCLKQRMLI